MNITSGHVVFSKTDEYQKAPTWMATTHTHTHTHRALEPQTFWNDVCVGLYQWNILHNTSCDHQSPFKVRSQICKCCNYSMSYLLMFNPTGEVKGSKVKTF